MGYTQEAFPIGLRSLLVTASPFLVSLMCCLRCISMIGLPCSSAATPWQYPQSKPPKHPTQNLSSLESTGGCIQKIGFIRSYLKSPDHKMLLQLTQPTADVRNFSLRIEHGDMLVQNLLQPDPLRVVAFINIRQDQEYQKDWLGIIQMTRRYSAEAFLRWSSNFCGS